MLGAKYLSLVSLVFQQTLLVLIIRYSKTSNPKGDDSGLSYLNSVAVASAEVSKLFLSFVAECISKKAPEATSSERKGQGLVLRLRRAIKPMLIFNDSESVKLVVPALMYLVQNNLLFVALANLSVPMYQVTNQGKLLTTALLSRVVLSKRLSWMQYLSIAILGFGVAFIHIDQHIKKEGAHLSEADGPQQNQILGLLAVLISCFTSSFSGVYFEFVLKKSRSNLSVHCRNFHLASWSLSFAVLQILFTDFDQVKEHGLFYGFDVWVVMIVAAQGMTGFVVSLVINYADIVLKGFAVSVAAVLATLLSVPLFGTSLSPSFLVGASMVATAVKMYSHYGINTEEPGANNKSASEGSNADEEESIGLLPRDGESK